MEFNAIAHGNIQLSALTQLISHGGVNKERVGLSLPLMAGFFFFHDWGFTFYLMCTTVLYVTLRVANLYLLTGHKKHNGKPRSLSSVGQLQNRSNSIVRIIAILFRSASQMPHC